MKYKKITAKKVNKNHKLTSISVKSAHKGEDFKVSSEVKSSREIEKDSVIDAWEKLNKKVEMPDVPDEFQDLYNLSENQEEDIENFSINIDFAHRNDDEDTDFSFDMSDISNSVMPETHADKDNRSDSEDAPDVRTEDKEKTGQKFSSFLTKTTDEQKEQKKNEKILRKIEKQKQKRENLKKRSNH